MLVVLQVRLVLPNVTRNSDNKSQVEQRLAGSVLTIEVGSLVLAPWSGWLLWSRSWSSWQLLVEGDNLAHSLGVSSATNVLWVSKMVVEECGEFEVVTGDFVYLDLGVGNWWGGAEVAKQFKANFCGRYRKSLWPGEME